MMDFRLARPGMVDIGRFRANSTIWAGAAAEASGMHYMRWRPRRRTSSGRVSRSSAKAMRWMAICRSAPHWQRACRAASTAELLSAGLCSTRGSSPTRTAGGAVWPNWFSFNFGYCTTAPCWRDRWNDSSNPRHAALHRVAERRWGLAIVAAAVSSTGAGTSSAAPEIGASGVHRRVRCQAEAVLALATRLVCWRGGSFAVDHRVTQTARRTASICAI